MSRKPVRTTIDLTALPPLMAEQHAELAALQARGDEAIDTSDIPELDDRFWASAERGRFYRPVKDSTTVRIDRDVLHWLRSKGRGYQTRINTILHEAMLRERA